MLLLLFLFRLCNVLSFFFFKQKTAYDMRISDWSSYVCSSDLGPGPRPPATATTSSSTRWRPAAPTRGPRPTSSSAPIARPHPTEQPREQPKEQPRARRVTAVADLVHPERRADGVAVLTLDNPTVNALVRNRVAKGQSVSGT